MEMFLRILWLYDCVVSSGKVDEKSVSMNVFFFSSINIYKGILWVHENSFWQSLIFVFLFCQKEFFILWKIIWIWTVLILAYQTLPKV